MQSKSALTVIDLTRQEQLELWMSRNSWTYKALGQLMGIAGSNAARLLKSETMPPTRYDQISAVVPVELLPQSAYLKPGPKPQAEASQVA